MTIASRAYQLSDDELAELIRWLRRQASCRLKQLPGPLTLQTTALVHEAFVRLLRSQSIQRFDNRAYRFAAASRAVREAFATAVRSRTATKRGFKLSRVNLLSDIPNANHRADFSDLHEAIELLSERRPRAATVVDLKFVAGFTIQEIAEMLGVSHTTVEADWAFAKEFIFRTLTR